MEEKERYKVYKDNRGNAYICDTIKNIDYKIYQEFVDLPNQQDKRIKELEEELDDAKRDYIPKLEFGLQRANKMGRDAEEENQQPKQQLHDLPKKIVCEISESIERLSWRKRIYTNWEFDKEQLYKDLDTILKKYGEEDE